MTRSLFSPSSRFIVAALPIVFLNCEPNRRVPTDSPAPDIGDPGGSGGTNAETGMGGRTMNDASTPLDASARSGGAGGSGGYSADAGQVRKANDGSINASTDGSSIDGATDSQDPRVLGLRFQSVWDGSQKDTRTWTSPSGNGNDAALVTDSTLTHSPGGALRWDGNDGVWVETGIFWSTALKDVADAHFLSVWVKVVSGKPPVNMTVGWHTTDAGCGRGGFTYPNDEGGVEVRNYNKQWSDGSWRQIIVPINDLSQGIQACVAPVDGLSLRGTGSSFTLVYDDVGFYF